MFSTQIYIYIAIFLSTTVVNNVSSKNAGNTLRSNLLSCHIVNVSYS
ncbi:hypothetical protein X975_02094, partial [Stegodyphus mimosarum]